MRVYIESYGCTMNHGEARLAAEALQGAGHTIVDDETAADANLIMTCTVIESTERRAIARMRALSSSGRRLVVSGCMASAQREVVLKVAPEAMVVPPRALNRLLEAFDDNGAALPTETAGPSKPSESVDAIVPIAQGCLGRCTYCITRVARGRLTSHEPEAIVARVRSYVRAGFKEIRLTAQDSAAYGRDIGLTLAGLLRMVSSVPGDFKVRVGMANPATCLGILDDLVDAYSSPKVYKFLHLPVQSGDDAILEAMRRDYHVSDFKHVVAEFRRARPDMTLSTDIIVGFPGETEEQFAASLRLVEEVMPDTVNVTRFSPRPMTSAATMPGQVVGWRAKERSRQLSRLRFSISRQMNASYEGRVIEAVTIERGKRGSTLARTLNYKQVVLDGEWPLGASVSVEIERGRDVDLLGRVVESRGITGSPSESYAAATNTEST